MALLCTHAVGTLRAVPGGDAAHHILAHGDAPWVKPLSASVAADHEVVRVDGHVAHAEDANLVRCQSMVLCVVREAREKVVARVNCLSCLVNFQCVYLYNSIRWQVCVRVCSVCVSALLISQFILHVHETYLADALDALHGNYVHVVRGKQLLCAVKHLAAARRILWPVVP